MCIWNEGARKVKLCLVKKTKHLHDCVKYSDEGTCHKFCEWTGEECIHLCQASKVGIDCKSSKVNEKLKICKYKKVKNPLFQKCIDLEKPVTDAPSAAKLTPSPTVTKTKIPTKRVTPSPTGSPTGVTSPTSGCSDDEGGKYFFRSMKGGIPNEVFKLCTEMPETRKSKICAFTESGVEDGVTYGPAKDVCRLTCGTCVTKTKTPTRRVTPSPTVVTSSPTAVTPSPTAAICSDDETGKYFFRSMKGGIPNEVFKLCTEMPEARKSKICAFTESGVEDGVTYGPAKDVCRLTCGTCSGDGRTVSLKGL